MRLPTARTLSLHNDDVNNWGITLYAMYWARTIWLGETAVGKLDCISSATVLQGGHILYNNDMHFPNQGHPSIIYHYSGWCLTVQPDISQPTANQCVIVIPLTDPTCSNISFIAFPRLTMDYPRGIFNCITNAQSNDLRALSHNFIFSDSQCNYGFLQVSNSEESNHMQAKWWLVSFHSMISMTVFLRFKWCSDIWLKWLDNMIYKKTIIFIVSSDYCKNTVIALELQTLRAIPLYFFIYTVILISCLFTAYIWCWLSIYILACPFDQESQRKPGPNLWKGIYALQVLL